MRGQALPGAALAGLCLLAACREQRQESFVERALGELAALKDSVTLADWLRTHPADTFVTFSAALTEEREESWCVRAAARIALPGGDTIRRTAFFYPPEPPAALELPPAADSAELIREHCLLGAIWVETPTPDSLAGQRLGQEARRAFTTVYGAVRAGPHPLPVRAVTDSQKRMLERFGGFEGLKMGVSFHGSAGWRVPGRWEAGATTIVSAYDAGFGVHARRRVLAFAYLPRSRFDLDSRDRLPDYDAVARQEDSLLGTAARFTGLDAGSTAGFLSLRAERVSDSTLTAIRRWLAAAAQLDSGRRAAALFVADGVVPGGLDRADSMKAKEYGKLGAEFVYSELDGSYNYTHPWLEAARRLDPDGPVGRLVRLQLLRSGFNTNGMCGGGAEAFRQVIGEGEALLTARGVAAAGRPAAHDDALLLCVRLARVRTPAPLPVAPAAAARKRRWAACSLAPPRGTAA